MRGRETSTSGIAGLEAALSRWEEIRAPSEQKPYNTPSVNTLKLFLLFPKYLFISEGIVSSLPRCVFTLACVLTVFMRAQSRRPLLAFNNES